MASRIITSDVLLINFKIYRIFILYAVFKVHIRTDHCHRANGDGEIRTLDPLLARQVLSQLSYTPTGSTRWA